MPRADDDAQLTRLCRACPSLAHADFAGRPLPPGALAALAHGVARSPHLLTLDLRGAGIDDAGATLLSQALRANASLREVRLEDNAIGAVGARALGRVAEEKPALLISVLRPFVLVCGAPYLGQAPAPPRWQERAPSVAEPRAVTGAAAAAAAAAPP